MERKEFLQKLHKKSFELVLKSIKDHPGMNSVWYAFPSESQRKNNKLLSSYIKHFINCLEMPAIITGKTINEYKGLLFQVIEKLFKTRFFYDFPADYAEILKEELNNLNCN